MTIDPKAIKTADEMLVDIGKRYLAGELSPAENNTEAIYAVFEKAPADGARALAANLANTASLQIHLVGEVLGDLVFTDEAQAVTDMVRRHEDLETIHDEGVKAIKAALEAGEITVDTLAKAATELSIRLSLMALVAQDPANSAEIVRESAALFKSAEHAEVDDAVLEHAYAGSVWAIRRALRAGCVVHNAAGYRFFLTQDEADAAGGAEAMAFSIDGVQSHYVMRSVPCKVERPC